MADIFLSYNESDREAVRRLSLALQSVGWSVWWDRRIPAGQTWRSVLAHELQTMRCMVVVWSARSVASEWVCEEATEGRQAGKLIPVMIEPVRPPAGFREVQAADLIGWDGDEDFPGLQQLIEDIGRLIYRPVDSHAAGTTQEPASGPDDTPHPAPPPRHAAENLTDTTGWNQWNRWLWAGAGGALLLAASAGFFAEHWRKRSLPPSTAPMAMSAVEDTKPAGAAGAAKPEPAEAPRAPVAKDGGAATRSDKTGLAATAGVAKNASVAAAGVFRPTAIDDATSAPAKTGGRRPGAVNPRCAALLERQQMGETLSAPSQRILDQEC
ncbi:MAG: hypothetical protein JWP29_17 [Rhodoferax sp.]|nr:hypothetical protein [Rhodoferax sp.]